MDDITPDPIMQIASGFMAAKFLFAANEFGFSTRSRTPRSASPGSRPGPA